MHGMSSRSMITNLYSLGNYTYLPQAIKDFFNNCTGTCFLSNYNSIASKHLRLKEMAF